MAKTDDPKYQTRRKNWDKREDLQRKSDLAELMSLPAFRRFIYDLIYRRCGLNDIWPEPNAGIYPHEGKRAVGAEIAMELQQAHAEQYILMIADRLQAVRVLQQIENSYQPGAEETSDGE